MSRWCSCIPGPSPSAIWAGSASGPCCSSWGCSRSAWPTSGSRAASTGTERVKAETRRKIEELFPLYPERRGALLPAIYLLQEEAGYVSLEGAHELAELFELKPVQVWEV